MRLVLTGNLAGALIKDWARETSALARATARVAQRPPVSSTQIVTLSPAAGETFTLGSAVTNTGGNSHSLVKTSLGAVVLASPNSHTGGTLTTNRAVRRRRCFRGWAGSGDLLTLCLAPAPVPAPDAFTSAMGVRAGERGQDGAAPTRLRWLGDRRRCASSRDFRNQ